MRAHEFADQGAAGIILYAEDTGRYGLQQRSDSINDPGMWAAWGGGREPGETLEQCATRELGEESGYTGPIELHHLADNPKYTTFIGVVPSEFEPTPCDEWKDYCWVEAGDWPAPMHPGVAAALKNIPVNENMDHSKDGRAVEELRAALVARKEKLQAASDDQVYDIIDKIMTRIARSHSISGQQLHDMWVDKYKQIPDTWIMNEDVPQPGASSGAPTQFAPGTKIQTRPMTAAQIIKSIPGVPYYNNVVDDWDAKDYSWGVTKKVIEYAKYLKQHPDSLEKLPPIQVVNGEFKDGAHRVSAIWLLQQRMDPKNPLWKNAKLNVQFAQQNIDENFADGKVRGKSRPGRVKRSGASCDGSVTDLRAKARKYGGERGKMYHWCANMKSGKSKANEEEDRYEGPYDGHNFGGGQIG